VHEVVQEVRRSNLQPMGRNIYVVEEAKSESDAFRSASGDFPPANLPDKRAKNDCIEEDLGEGFRKGMSR
jgi:hypothetical protein